MLGQCQSTTSERRRIKRRSVALHDGNTRLIRFRNCRGRRRPVQSRGHSVEDLSCSPLCNQAFLALAAQKHAAIGRIEREKVLTPGYCRPLFVFLFEQIAVGFEKARGGWYIRKLQTDQQKRLHA